MFPSQQRLTARDKDAAQDCPRLTGDPMVAESLWDLPEARAAQGSDSMPRGE